MKQFVLTTLLALTGFITIAQPVTIVPNPDYPDIFGYTANSPLSGYAGDPIVYNSNLYLQYQPGTSTFSGDMLQLARYNTNNTLTKIPNPDNGKGYVFNSVPIVYNNKLYIRYRNAAGSYQVGVYDGTSLTLIPNPTTVGNNQGYIDNPVLYNGNLYILYKNASNVEVLAQVNASNTLTLIANPDASTYGYQGNAIVFNGKLCLNYIIAGNNANVIAQFNGTTTTLLPNPDNTAYGYQGNPIIYNNKLYVQYYGNVGQNQLMVYDGTNNPSLITNPTTTANAGYVGLPIVYNSNLYYQYYTGSTRQLAKFDGTTITLIPNPDASPYGMWNTPIVYNNQLCFFYRNAAGVHRLAVYSGGSSFTLIANPDASGNGYWDLPIVYGTNLYYQYYNASNTFQLGYFNGTTMTLIPNPAGFYSGYPILFNNLLYMQYQGASYQYAGNLAYFNQVSLPLTFLNFTATKAKESTLLNWQTVNEVNTSYAEVQRANDSLSFITIGLVKAATFTTSSSYSFTDNSPMYGTNFYRLKQVDKDGKYTYSKTVSVYFPKGAGQYTLYPTPARQEVYIIAPAGSAKAAISVYNLHGQKVVDAQIAANSVSQKVDITKLPAGVYQVVISQEARQQTIRMVKE